MKPIILAAALLLAAPASAQSFFPNLFGSRYCELRRMGIDATQARDAAMSESWSNSRKPVYVNWNGQRIALDVLEAGRYVVLHCPEA